ncbi:MAG TPA: hypothetical protein VM121_03660 [Acidimicrobiales bacterium]|nr:hypothetical protein [Acidimicrobiales bacterium]
MSHGENPPGVSMISTLVVFVIMGALGAVVLSSVPFGDSSDDPQTQSLMNDLNGGPTPAGQVAGGAAVEAEMGGPSAGAGNPPSLSASARTAACKTNLDIIDRAVLTKYSTEGSFPSSIDELVTGHWIDSVPSTKGYDITLEIVDGKPTGHVLVNGRAGAEACDAPAPG